MGMKNSGKRNLSLTLLTLLIIAGVFIVTGCSGGGGGASGLTGGDTGGDTGDTNPYSGGATISGKIDVDSLSSSDQALLGKAVAGKTLSKISAKETRAYRQLYAASFTEDAVAKLYVVAEDGSLEDTGISGELSADADGNPVYTFNGVADGVNYVVRYLKLVSDGQVLELKANAYVPEGETAPEGGSINISPKTTVVVQALVDAILNATSGTGISQTIVNNIITAVKNAIVALVEAGVIQIPSMVIEASGSDIMTIADGETTNNDLANASGLLLSDDSVDSELGAMKTEALAARFSLADVTTDVDKEALIIRVFDELMKDDSGDGGGIESFYLDFFTDIYIANTTRTVSQIMDAIAAGLMFRPDVQAPDISKIAAINAFKDKLVHIYSLMDKKTAGTLTEDEKKELAEVPPILLGLFPITERAIWSSLSASTSLNVPQGLAMTIYIVDVYIAEAFSEMQASYTASEGGDGTVSHEKEMPFDFNPMVPGSLMDNLGFYAVYQNYAGVDIFHLWVHPGKAWLESSPGNGHEVDMLSAGTCLSDVASMVEQFRPDLHVAGTDLSNAVITLTYPKSGGTIGSIELVSEASFNNGGPGPGGMGESCFIVDPMREAWAQQDPNSNPGPVQPDLTRVISDFASGTYTVTVEMSGAVVATKSFTKKVITGMTNAYVTINSPRSMPPWPGMNASQTERDAFNAAMADYNTAGGESRFSSNVDTGSDGVNDAAKITVTWTAPTVTLPAGVKMGYHLDIGKGGCNPDCTWQQIYNTWEHNKMLFTTSFIIPVNLPQDDTTPYQLNVNVIFIDAVTGEQLGQGGNTHAQFWVAEPLNKNLTFTIAGLAAVGYKVALFKEVENKDSLTNRFTRTVVKVADVVDGGYSLEPTIGDFVDSAGAWFNIVMFQDTNADGTMDNTEMQIWPDWNSATRIWFNNWGGMLRAGKDTCTTPTDGSIPVCQHSEVVILGGEMVEGPSFAAPMMP